MVVSATRNMHGRVGQVCVQRVSVGSQPVQALGICWFKTVSGTLIAAAAFAVHA